MTTSLEAESDEAVEEIAAGQRSRVVSFVSGMLRDRVEAEDVFQEVMVEYVEARGLGEAIESVGAWLLRVARNKVLDRFRRRKTAEDSLPLLELDDELAPGNEWMRGWMRAEIADAIATLPPEQREAFVRNEIEGESFEKIAADTGVSINTLLSRKQYAVLALRDMLKEVYDELE